jgi:hypothetical protein
MKKILFFLLISIKAFSQGSVKISDMPAATSLTGTEIVPIVQGGINKKATVSLWPNNTIVVSSNTTAVNDAVYTVVASATFTDPTPVEGKGFTVFIRNGTGTVGGTGYSVAGTVIKRIFHSGAWANYADAGGFTIASLAEAQAGNDNTKGMTPKRVSDVNEIVFNITAYGAVGDGTTDNTTAINNCLAAIYSAGGGTMYVPVGVFRVNSQIVIPNDGVVLNPKNKSIKILGAGRYWSNQTFNVTAQGGSILDMRYTGIGAKLLTLGFGALEITNITITTLGNDFSTPFVMTTNTRLYIHDASFFGNNAATGTSVTQDCIVLGGTGTTTNNTIAAPFQGYGTVIENCNFDFIRRAVWGQTYCNGITVRSNWVMVNCGGSEAFRFIGDVTNSSAGNVFQNNVLEVTNYTQMWYLDRCVNFSFTDNSSYDNINSTCAFMVFNTSLSQNHFWRDGGFQAAPIFGGSNPQLNSINTSSSGGTNVFSSNIQYYGLNTIKGNDGLRHQRAGTGEIWYRNTDAGADKIVDYIDRTPVGGGLEGIGTLWRTGATSARYTYSATNFQIEGSGDLRLWSASGSSLIFGDAGSGTTSYVLNNTWHFNDATGLKLGSTTGLNWTGGTAGFGVEARLERQSSRRLRITDGGSAVGSLSSTFINPALFANDAAADAGFIGATAPDGTIYSNSSTGAPRAKISGTWTALTGGGGGTYYAPSTLVANATDANFTATLNGVHNILDGVASANRVITIPTGSNGDVMKFYNTEDTRVWSFTGETVYLADRVTVVTELLYNVPCHMERIDGRWIITN